MRISLLCFRVANMQADTATISGDNACMPAFELARMFNAAGMCNHTHVMQDIINIMLHTHSFICWIKAAL